MNAENKNLITVKSIVLARRLLGEVMGRLSETGGQMANADQVREVVDHAVRGLPGGLQGPHLVAQGANSAMDSLRRAMDLTSGGDMMSETVRRIAENLAKTMAVLYPLTRAASKMAQQSAETAPTMALPLDGQSEKRYAPPHERRASTRILIEADIGFQSESNFFIGLTENVSSGGLFVATESVLPVGARLTVNFTLPDGHLISADGVVRWTRTAEEGKTELHSGMGIQFENLTLEDEQAIEDYTRQRPPITRH